MLEYTEKIRETAARLLTNKEVDVFIGYKKGTVPMVNEPLLINSPEGVDLLYWDSNCGLNLCNYLTKRTDRIGIVANGCNSRNMVTHLVENQIKREQLYIVGIPCTGIIDHRGVRRALNEKEILAFHEDDGMFTVTGCDFEETFNKKDFLRTNCLSCTHRNPVIYDELVHDPVPEQEGVDAYPDVKKVEEMDPESRWAFFSGMIEKCLRCYACRKSIDPTDTMTFHIMRAYHCAGRCTDCGACERVCPVGIEVRQFTKKLNKDVLRLFSWEAGLNPEERPPLDNYRPDDYNDFIR
jgi:formate dehydrogenase subunit beta